MFKLIFYSGILLLAIIQAGDCTKKTDQSLPPECTTIKVKDKSSSCVKGGGFRYNVQTNTCFYSTIKDFCPGKNGFTTMEQCVYKCWDYTKMDEREKIEKNKDVCIKKINEDEMEAPIPIPGVGAFKDNRCREPNEKGLEVGTKPTKNPAYKYDKDKNVCVPVKTNVCMGRNRFSLQDECIHICVWNKGSGRFRHNVRAGKA
uniref:Putative salivary protease inhibitor n=1 Tax=Culicoides nubeculosus TaxID=144565 RepID=B9URL3_CULNU|nr:putative salivary protease inhibitor [Culicoides nubeculosus]